MRARATPILDENGKPIRAVGVFFNINPEKQEMELLRKKSQLDPLTRLYNKGEVSRRTSRAYLTELPLP